MWVEDLRGVHTHWELSVGAPTRMVTITLMVTVILTVVSTSLVRQTERRNEQARLDAVAQGVGAMLEQEFVRLVDLGMATQAALEQIDELTPTRYEELMTELGVTDRYRTLISVSLLERIPREALDQAVAQRARHGEFTVREDAGEDHLRLFLYSSPPSVADEVVGVDLTSRSDSRQAMDRALADGAPRLSSLTQIIQLDEGTPGASIHIPIRDPNPDREATLGIVVAGDAFLEQLQPIAGNISVSVIDQESMVFPAFAQVGEEPRTGVLTASLDVTMGGQTWTISVAAGQGFGVPLFQRGSTYLGVAGALASVLISLLVWTTASRERYARDLAAQRTRDLVRANEALIDADRYKDQFLASVSHELRTPLTVLGGFAETLARVPPEDRRDLVAPIQRNVKRLSRLVEDLLTLASLDEGGVVHVPERIELASFLAAAPEELAGVDPEEVEIDVPDGLYVWVDPRYLDRMITNLLTNAAKHGSLPLEIRARAVGDGTVRLSVRDHGPGVTEPARRELFTRFARGSEEVRSSGTGLGLAIVRELAELTGGELRYEPADPGARFILQLPVPPDEVDQPGDEVDDPGDEVDGSVGEVDDPGDETDP